MPENQLATVDVFGSWQTEKYIPQPIVDVRLWTKFLFVRSVFAKIVCLEVPL